jgi:hypothetical protein
MENDKVHMNIAERATLPQDNDNKEEEGLIFGHPSDYWYILNATNPSSIYQRCLSRHSPLFFTSPSEPFRLIGSLKSVIVSTLNHQPLGGGVLDDVGVGLSISAASDMEQGRLGCEGKRGIRIERRGNVFCVRFRFVNVPVEEGLGRGERWKWQSWM